MLCGDLNGKEIQNQRIYVYVYLIDFVVQQKQTHYKAITLQLKTMELDLDIALKMGFFQYIGICYVTC